jgi:hypothetical protein
MPPHPCSPIKYQVMLCDQYKYEIFLCADIFLMVVIAMVFMMNREVVMCAWGYFF